MAKAASAAFRCQSCETKHSKWYGKCPSCEEWNSLQEIQVVKKNSPSKQAVHWRQIEVTKATQRRPVGLNFVDRVLNGGLPPGTVVLLAGQPGIGKSTLLFQLFGSSTQKVLFASTEESETQLSLRFQSFCKRDEAEFYLMSEYIIENILAEAERLRVDTLVIDSIQMLTSLSTDRQKGGMGLMRELSDELVSRTKAAGVNLWIVGHVNKEGDIAGPKSLEHMVDTVLLFSASDNPSVRTLQVQKHRFGPSGELALLKMEADGLHEVPNAEEFWMHKRQTVVPGCVYCPVLLGSRVYCIEVQALCAETVFPSPRRTAAGYDLQRLHLLLAILEKRLKINFSGLDVYLNVVGGLRLHDTGVDLAVAAALVSACQERAMETDSVYVGELGLTGEIRPVPGMAERLEASARVGKKMAIVPRGPDYAKSVELEIRPYGDISELFGA